MTHKFAVFANPAVKAYKKRTQKMRERKQIASIDWPRVKKAIEPAVKQGECELACACPFWATIGKHHLKSIFGLDCQIWKGKAAVSWVERPNTVFRNDSRAWLWAHSQSAPQPTDDTKGNYHVWLETKEYIIDLANYGKSVPCPNNLLVIRRDEPTVYCYIPECEILPKWVNGSPVYEIEGFTITFHRTSIMAGAA